MRALHLAPGVLAFTALISSAASAQSRETAEGWGSIVPGMSFEEVVSLETPFRWTPESIAECRENLPGKTCWLLTHDTVRLAGEIFGAYAIFTESGQLSVVNLSTETENNTARGCADRFARVLAVLEEPHGQMTDPRPDERPPLPNWHETPAGGRYYLDTSFTPWVPETGPVVTNNPAAYNAPYPAPAPPHVSLEAEFHGQSCGLFIGIKARFGEPGKEN
ncbi:hypothetical protein ACSHT0_17275 [Tepidicaulis sp. LMO-SS28]|uniref:hypothetical protein n=1 Tax=Tepidicaulis sp. LMO-SS28 TaxID=3447455 RepID=UPI003EE19F04